MCERSRCLGRFIALSPLLFACSAGPGEVADRPPAAADGIFGPVLRGGLFSVGGREGLGALATDADSGRLTFALVRGPAHGTLSLTEDGGFSYHHDGGGTDIDGFTYTASDAHSRSNAATVRLLIGRTGAPPSARDHDRGLAVVLPSPN